MTRRCPPIPFRSEGHQDAMSAFSTQIKHLVNGRIQSLISAVLLITCIGFVGCAEATSPESEEAAPPVQTATASDSNAPVTIRELRRQLKVNELAEFEKVGIDIVGAKLFRSGAKDLSPLEGLPLRRLDLGFTEVSDLSALKGMPLTSLILEDTQVTDLSALKGLQLRELHLHNSPVTDLSILAGMPLEQLNLSNVPITSLQPLADLPLNTLWIPGTKVTDLSPLANQSLVSLDIENTDVDSLEALSTISGLERLNIVNTKVTDLSPLQGLKLQRISLTPENITAGMETLRSMPSLTQILTANIQYGAQSADVFWAKYDAGVYTERSEDSESNTPQQDQPQDSDSTDDGNTPPQPETKDPSSDNPPASETSAKDSGQKAPSDRS